MRQEKGETRSDKGYGRPAVEDKFRAVDFAIEGIECDYAEEAGGDPPDGAEDTYLREFFGRRMRHADRTGLKIDIIKKLKAGS